MKPRRPRKGQPGHRSRQAGARRRPNDDRLHAHARRMERRYTQAGQKEKKMHPENTEPVADSQARVENSEGPAPEQPAEAVSETQDSLDSATTADVGGEG